jgi:hypothetical protein
LLLFGLALHCLVVPVLLCLVLPCLFKVALHCFSSFPALRCIKALLALQKYYSQSSITHIAHTVTPQRNFNHRSTTPTSTTSLSSRLASFPAPPPNATITTFHFYYHHRSTTPTSASQRIYDISHGHLSTSSSLSSPPSSTSSPSLPSSSLSTPLCSVPLSRTRGWGPWRLLI